MDIYFDTEFTDFVIDPALISIGFAANDGREFYTELNDTYEEVMCSCFVIETVLPSLWGDGFELSLHELAPRIKAWIESFGEPVTLWTDSPEFDWAWVWDIFERSACGWPGNLVRNRKSTQQFANDDEQMRFRQAYEAYWLLQVDTDAVQHHALWDARSIRHAHRYALANRRGEIA